MKYNKLRIELGALATGMFYNAQQERLKAFNRIRQVIFREIEGVGISQKQDKKEQKEYEEKYTDRQLIKYIEENKVKLNKDEQEYVDQLMKLLNNAIKKESEYKRLMQCYIEQEPIYKEFLKDIKGISTLNTANLLQYFGYCENAKHASSLWKFCGLHVINGKAPKLSMYGKGKDVETGLDYNPKLRTLMYRIGDCFIKQRTIKYRDIYDTEKERQLKMGGWDIEKKKMHNKDVEGMPQSLGHADNRARRKMVKHFLVDYYENCLKLRGIEPDKCYAHRND